MINAEGANWTFIDKLCQMANIPFLPKEWENIAEMTGGAGTFGKYAEIFLSSEYDGIEW
jgi:hypothetical protein